MLPLFFDGLRETKDPMFFFADQCTNELITNPERTLPVIPKIVTPIKLALQTKRPDLVLKVLDKIIVIANSSPECAQAFVPFYTQILPTLNILLRQRVLNKKITETLEAFETNGDYFGIKHCVPTYQTCVFN